MIHIHEGSILDVAADYIVNPANSFMQHGGGLAAVIDREAQAIPAALIEAVRRSEDTPSLRSANAALDAAVDRQQAYRIHRDHALLIPTGGAILGPPGMLPYKGIIHTVGPIWGGGGLFEFDLLTAAYGNALCVASAERANSIVFPAISAGIFGVPIDEVAHAARGAVVMSRGYASIADVTFALTDPAHVAAFKKEFNL